jgi:hypothetical protein
MILTFPDPATDRFLTDGMPTYTVMGFLRQNFSHESLLKAKYYF